MLRIMSAYLWYRYIVPVADTCLYEYSLNKKKIFHRNLVILRLQKHPKLHKQEPHMAVL